MNNGETGVGLPSAPCGQPGLIDAACSGFGQTGHYLHRPAYDVIIQAIGRTDLENYPRFTTDDIRTLNADDLAATLNEAFGTRDRVVWLSILEAAGVPCGPINNVADVLADPKVTARLMIVEVNHPVAGTIKVASSPIKLSEDSEQDYRPSPTPWTTCTHYVAVAARIGWRRG